MVMDVDRPEPGGAPRVVVEVEHMRSALAALASAVLAGLQPGISGKIGDLNSKFCILKVSYELPFDYKS